MQMSDSIQKINIFIKNNKYLWFYPKDKKNIKLLHKSNNKSQSKKHIKNLINSSKEKQIILFQFNYRKKTTKFFPTKFNIKITFFILKNNRLKEDRIEVIFFKDKNLKYALKNKTFLKIIKKFYFKQVKSKPLENLYYFIL
jgi:hypothetical protein